jgi:FKBP-type peptidyl-prolyl cis-trans isomerase FklB
MKKLFALAVLMVCAVNMASAQDKPTDKAALKAEKEAAKAAKKAAKEAEKAAKKAAKNKGAEVVDLTTAQTGLTAQPAFQVPTHPLTNGGDSIAYIFGLSQADGLKEYMKKQLNVDSVYTDKFSEGIVDRLGVAPDDKEKSAYFQGMTIGSQIEQMAASLTKDYYSADPDMKIDPKIVADGIFAGLYGTDAMKSPDAMKKFQSQMEARKQDNLEKQYGENKVKGAQFLAENRTKPGVVELPSGLQYKVITEGTGEKPKATSKVKVNYEGHLIDGTEFDSSYKRKEPTSFKCNQVIKGWTEALCLMPVGSKWELYIPYNLAYGERAAGKIPPFSTLIFTVELLEIEPVVAPAKTTANPARPTVNTVKPTVVPAKPKK